MTQPDTKRLLSILIPAYNERAFLRRCLEQVLAAPLPDGLEREVILVDDKSTDGTTELIAELAAAHPETVRAFYQPKNQGKGAAIRRAISEMSGDYAIFQDADLEYDPNEYGRVLKPILTGHADVVYGSRFAASPMRRVLNYHHALGNVFLTHLSNSFSGLNLTDMETCYKAFRADVLKTIPIRSNRFGIEPEITAKVAKRQCVVYEVPISYHGRSYNEGKKIGWKDGLSALYTIIKYGILDDCYNERYGHSILNDLSHARRLNRWMVSVIERHLGRRILEVGSGIGNISRFLPKRSRLTVTDLDPIYLEMLAQTYRDHDLVDTAKLDLNDEADIAALDEGQYDTVVCLNVLEHIDDDRGALERLRRLLEPGGRLVLLVPQYEGLYGTYDKQLGHVRRYTRAGVTALLAKAGFRMTHIQNFNAPAILGWWLNARLFKRESMGRGQIKLFEMLVPLFRPLERLLPLPGISLICVAEAKSSPQSS